MASTSPMRERLGRKHLLNTAILLFETAYMRHRIGAPSACTGNVTISVQSVSTAPNTKLQRRASDSKLHISRPRCSRLPLSNARELIADDVTPTTELEYDEWPVKGIVRKRKTATGIEYQVEWDPWVPADLIRDEHAKRPYIVTVTEQWYFKHVTAQYRWRDGKRQRKVEWSQPTWEPEANLVNAWALVAVFEADQQVTSSMHYQSSSEEGDRISCKTQDVANNKPCAFSDLGIYGLHCGREMSLDGSSLRMVAEHEGGTRVCDSEVHDKANPSTHPFEHQPIDTQILPVQTRLQSADTGTDDNDTFANFDHPYCSPGQPCIDPTESHQFPLDHAITPVSNDLRLSKGRRPSDAEARYILSRCDCLLAHTFYSIWTLWLQFQRDHGHEETRTKEPFLATWYGEELQIAARKCGRPVVIEISDNE